MSHHSAVMERMEIVPVNVSVCSDFLLIMLHTEQ